jgi:enoyl-[acyl-carrier protein] reductase I
LCRRLRSRRPAQGQEGARLRRRQRPLDRLGHRQSALRPGRRGRLQLDGVADQAARPTAGRLDRLDLRRRRDVRDDDEIRKVFERWHAREGDLDILVHAVAYAEREDLDGHFTDISRSGFHTAFDISVYSLIAMAREARPYMKPGSSIMTMTYYAAEKVVPNYNVMGVAKAALEATTRYLAADLGPSGIRVNAISAGPVRTLSAHGIAGFRTMYGAFKDVTPLRSHISIEDVGNTAVYLASPLSSQTTGEVIYVDGGFNILAMPVAAIGRFRPLRGPAPLRAARSLRPPAAQPRVDGTPARRTISAGWRARARPRTGWRRRR